MYAVYDGLYRPFKDDREQMTLFNAALTAWQQRSMFTKGYDELNLRFYDGVIGTVIERCNLHYRDSQKGSWVPPGSLEFMELWSYTGDIYKVINASASEIRYHNKIASWSKNFNAFKCFNHFDENCQYTFIVAKTKGTFGFDINKYMENIRQANPVLKHEEEIIFPMNKEYITDVFYGTLAQFETHMLSLKENNKVEC